MLRKANNVFSVLVDCAKSGPQEAIPFERAVREIRDGYGE